MANEQEKSNLKDWEDVPKDFTLRAYNEGGDLWYFKLPELRPTGLGGKTNKGFWEIKGVAQFIHGGELGAACETWRETLEQRPPNV